MEISITLTEKQIQEGIEACVKKSLESTYNNPINDAVTAALKEKDGIIKTFVNELITEAVSKPEFKSKLADIVLAKMLELALKKN